MPSSPPYFLTITAGLNRSLPVAHLLQPGSQQPDQVLLLLHLLLEGSQ
jgi:hypothetical protein